MKHEVNGEFNPSQDAINDVTKSDRLAEFRNRILTRRDFLKLAGVTGTAYLVLGHKVVSLSLPSVTDNRGKKVTTFDSEEDRQNAIQATAAAVEQTGWSKLENEGFPETAINTAVSIQAFEGPDESWSGSGTVMFIKDLNGQSYWVVLTAGHLFLEGTHQELQRLVLGRKSLPHAGQESFTSDEFGVAAAHKDQLYKNTDNQAKGLDIGIIVLPDTVVNGRLNNLVETDRALSMEQIKFERTIESGTFSAIGFPGFINLEPTVIHKGVPGPTRFEEESGLYSVLVDNALSAPGVSGGGTFWTPPNNDKSLYVGPLSKGFDSTSQTFARSVRVTKIAMLGEQGLQLLIQNAISELNSRQDCPTGVCALDTECGPNSYCVEGSCVPKDQFDISGH